MGITNNELSLDGLTTDVGGDGVGSFLRDTRLELIARAVIGRREALDISLVTLIIGVDEGVSDTRHITINADSVAIGCAGLA